MTKIVATGLRMLPHQCGHGLPCQKTPSDRDGTPTCLRCAKEMNERQRAAAALADALDALPAGES